MENFLEKWLYDIFIFILKCVKTLLMVYKYKAMTQTVYKRHKEPGVLWRNETDLSNPFPVQGQLQLSDVQCIQRVA